MPFIKNFKYTYEQKSTLAHVMTVTARFELQKLNNTNNTNESNIV